MQMKQPEAPQMPAPELAKLTPQDLEDREDFKYLLSVMERQRAVGITQPLDYVDAMKYRDGLEEFKKRKTPEGSIVELYDDIIFDFDGVLYDNTYPIYTAARQTLEKLADKNIPRPSSIKEIANSYQQPYEAFYKRFNISQLTDAEEASFLDNYRKLVKQAEEEHQATFYPEIKIVLEKLRQAKKINPNLKIHIVSSGSEKRIKDALTEFGFIDDFDDIHTNKKTKKDWIQGIRDKSASHDKVIMIGDLPSDIKDAQLVDGVKTIAVARGEIEQERLSMYLPDYIVTNLEGIFALKALSEELKKKQ